MIPGLKVENDKIVLDVPQILLYKPLAAIYQADNSNNKEFAHKRFLYIEHVADKKGYCRTKGFSKQEAHKWAARNSGLKESYVPDKLVTDAIDFIKREFESHPVEDAIETNIQGIRASLTLISIIANELNNAITDYRSNPKEAKIEDLLSYETSIKTMASYSADLPKRIQVLSELKKQWDDIDKGITSIRGGKSYKNSYDGTDDLSPTSAGEVEELR
mgnify:FL=1